MASGSSRTHCASRLARSCATASPDLLENASKRLVGRFTNEDRILEARRSTGTAGDDEYYAKKRDAIIATAAIQEYYFEEQLKRYAQEKLAGEEAIKNAKKVADVQEKLAELRAGTATSLTINDLQRGSAANGRNQSILDFRSARETALADQMRGDARERSLAGLGRDEAQRLRGRGAIEDDYADRRREVEKRRNDALRNKTLTPDLENQFEAELQIIDEYLGKELDRYDTSYAERRRLEADAFTGSRKAIADYVEESGKAGQQAYEAWSKPMRGIEDALTSFVTTGKADFKGLVQSIISEVVRMGVIKPVLASIFGGGSSGGGGAVSWLSLLSAFGSIFGGGAASSGSVDYSLGSVAGRNPLGRAAGGPVEAGKTYLVGEKGPEHLVMGPNRGWVVPNGGEGKSVSISYAPVIQVDSRSDRAAVMRDTASMLQENNRQMLEQLKASGVIG